ncbi:Protein translocase subunit SecD [uncultured Desulfobacterium sp.]|uniref:Protein translocase subunit SecD n=1 Tax=uncultured Desulfobacterium sp. TaxID=201089 RepID=A0A445MV10_9BACT|nr:Protein translocase subunit SecD [uncultured Desulfobacterium sp.]
MSKNLGWRAGVVLFSILWAIVFLIPSLTDQLPVWWSHILPKDKIRLGLDLQGGIHLVLEVESVKALESHLESVIDDLKNELRRKKIRYAEIKRQGMEKIVLTLINNEDTEQSLDSIKGSYSDFDVSPSSDDKGAPVVTLSLKKEAVAHIRKFAVDQALETIRNRIDQFGVSEPEIRPQEDDRILVQLPGVSDPKRAVALIGKTALLEFKLVDDEHSIEDALKGNIPPGDEILYEYSIDPKTGLQKKEPLLLKKRSVLTGQYLTDARVQIDNRYNEPYVSLSFDSRGAKIFERVTGENIKKRLAIVLDDKVNSAPVIQDKIAGGRAQITGRFSMEDARDLAIVLRAGALPAPVKILEERTVGPSLGKDSIEKGSKSMMIGGIAVIIFMVIYYSFSGIIANLALILNILFIMAGLAFFGATLTLPGIAGIVLTIGMAVDANVLIYERMREELRLGKTPRSAIDEGYSKAWVAIFDSNVTTLIAGLVLFQFGTGPIRGFAVTLCIGIVSTLYSAVFCTRIIFDYLYVHRNMKKISI